MKQKRVKCLRQYYSSFLFPIVPVRPMGNEPNYLGLGISINNSRVMLAGRAHEL